MSIYKDSKYIYIKEYTYTRNTQEDTLYTDIKKDILMILKMSVLISLNYSRIGMNRKGGGQAHIPQMHNIYNGTSVRF